MTNLSCNCNIDLRFIVCILSLQGSFFLNVNTKLVIITGGCDTMGKAIEIRTRLGVRSGDDGQSMGRRDARAWHDEVPEAHLWVLYSQCKSAEICYYYSKCSL